MVGEEGLEPSCLAAPAPKAGVSANFTTRPGEVGAVYEQVLKRSTLPPDRSRNYFSEYDTLRNIMATRRIIAVGGGLGLDSDDCSQFNRWLLSQTRKRDPRVLYLPTASGDSPRRALQFQRIINDLGYRGDALSLFEQNESDLRAKILSYDLIYVGGGNTANMMAIWDVHELRPIIQEAYERGTVLCGKSAGSLCWFETGLTDSFGPELKPIRTTMGLLKGSYVPHYNTRDWARHELYADLVANGTLPEGIGAPDGVTLSYEDEQLVEVIGEHRELRAFRLSKESAAEGGVQIVPNRIIENDSIYEQSERPLFRRPR